MRRVWCVLMLLSGTLLLAAQLSEASASLRVDETATRLLLHEDSAEALLIVHSSRQRPAMARVTLELINELNRSLGKVERDVVLNPGPNTIAGEFQMEASRYALWRRLRYQVTTTPASAGGTASGVISLSQICPDIFELNLIKPLMASVGARYQFRVRAEHPISFRPVQGVSLLAEMAFEGLAPLSRSGVTDAEGYAEFAFDLPADVKSEGEIKLTGKRNGLSAHVEEEVRIDRTTRVSLSTDKNIYQPGQTLHVRALALDPSRRALGGIELTLTILDPDDAVVHRASLKTTRFGVASDDWAIPANVRLGDYQIKLDRDESDEEDVYTPVFKVRISRYELPNFAVRVKPDRAFYLPGQNAEVEVRGDYLFGQPVTRGRVRVVRETEREWNYREQKWEITEEEKYEGELDQSGRFVAKLDLSSRHDDLRERDYRRFDDVSYAAYITDLTTNRTEQRRFDLRLTKEPIHIYVIDERNRVRGEPVTYYVSTYYADGAPAECEVEISQDVSTAVAGVHIGRSRYIRTVKTNRYGVARAAGLVIAEVEEQSIAARRYRDAELSFAAHDSVGRSGHTTKTEWYSSSESIRVETNKAVYKPGETIDVRVRATGRPPSVFIDVAQRWKVVHSQTIPLVNGRGRLSLPYRREFTDEVAITAYGYTKAKEFFVGTRAVLFPRRHELKVDVNLNQPQYKPGEEATAAFQVQTGGGQPVESAIGVSVIDRAVEERTRTDAEFGQRNDFERAFRRLWGYDEDVGGVTLKSLEGLDPSSPIPADLQLAAEVLLLRRGYWIESHGSSIGGLQSEFGDILKAQLKPVKRALDSRYSRTKQYPLNAAMLTRELAEFGLDLPRMLDPWGLPYIPKFSVSRDRDVLELISPGPDKRAGTRDDFTVAEQSWPYFRTVGETIDRAVQRYHARTGGFIRDRRSLKRELMNDAIDIDALRDRWSKPYRFEFGVSGNYYVVEVKSGGKDRRLEARGKPSADDFAVWTSKIDYFAGARASIEAALTIYFHETNRFPQQAGDLKAALGGASIDWDSLRDPWGNRYYAAFRSESRYGDRIKMITFKQYLEEARQRTEITPVTRRINFIYLRSSGKDGKEGTPDDFEAASYSRIVAEQGAQDPTPAPPSIPAGFSGATGAISGTVTDPNGAVINGAKLKATNKRSGQFFEAETGQDGRFIFENLPAGLYEVQIGASGFRSTIIADVPVNSSTVTELSATLGVGVVAEAVEVTAVAEPVQTQSMSLAVNVVEPAKTSLAAVKQLTETSTPRLREYFPETLVWRPSIETDAGGRARLKFKLADNITTWKMSVIASTEDGEIGAAEKEILAFQPFFIEHDPPRVLTEGDEIALPIVLRNYLDRSQPVDLEIKPERWFTLVGPARKHADIAAGDSAREVFDIRAVASVDDGKQRVTATGPEASDAVEKPVAVHPDGQEVTQTATQVFSDTASIAFAVSEAAIPGSSRAELKIYPNLMAHVIESVEGIMKRPYGCAEQTISSAYPSVLLLKFLKAKGDASSELAQKARRYIDAAYERLLNYRDGDGAFTYWGRGEGDPALTAYALRFLTDARALTAVDPDIIKEAREWLIKDQRPDGSWPPRFTTDVDRLPSALRTAFIARVLASTNSDDERPSTVAALRRALTLLRQRIDEIDEPYLIASYGLAAMSAGDKDGAARAIEKLRALAHDEGVASYWKLETNTPFYGWGVAGRIEATALAVQALASSGESGVRSSSRLGGASSRPGEELVNRGLLFLLRQKDREGVWHSTQATVNVLDSLMTVLGKREPQGTSVNTPAEVFVNGNRAALIPFPPAGRLSEPILTDISRFLSAGSNRIEIRRAAGSPQASAQIVESHYEPWPEIADAARQDSASAGALRLRVSFDKTQARIGGEITCTVNAERVGSRGYGMMLAEIGLPPGADVDRASLDRAVSETGWDVDQYDVLPDRLIVYLWPEAGGTRFQFKFRPRFGLAARTAPSVVYDYYNPEARAVVAPTKFVVR